MIRSLILSFVLGVWSLLVGGISFAAAPNILMIVSEDNGPELGCYGDRYARTPHLDQLAASGARFSRAYVAQAGCSQSRASLLTGLYPHQHGQIGLATWGFRLYRKETPNLPRILKTIGYRTGIIGKLHINPASAFEFDFHEIKSSNFARKNLTDYARHAESFITAGEKPFFLSVNYPDAHKPWIRQAAGLPQQPQTGDDVHAMPYMGIDPPAMRDMVADHYNCMSRLDSLVGELLKVLDRSGQADNTIVIYLGDHGADFLRGKRTCYEGGLRVPLMVRWPGQIAPQVRDELVSTVDLMPTLLDAAEAAPVDGLAGMSLLPLVRGDSQTWRTHLFAEYHTHAAAPNYFPQRCVRSDRFKLIESLLPETVHPDYDTTIRKLHEESRGRTTGDTLNLHSAIDRATPEVRGAYRLMLRPPRYQLYDLQHDPPEFRNLADSPEHAKVLSELRHRLDQWRQKTGDPLLDAEVLRRLTTEVQSVKDKAAGKRHSWKYPDYFFE